MSKHFDQLRYADNINPPPKITIKIPPKQVKRYAKAKKLEDNDRLLEETSEHLRKIEAEYPQ
jgi:hypothetical protein